jgi:hypothetical protein
MVAPLLKKGTGAEWGVCLELSCELPESGMRGCVLSSVVVLLLSVRGASPSDTSPALPSLSSPHTGGGGRPRNASEWIG